MFEREEGLLRVTNNLRKRREDLIESKENAATAAFSRVYESEYEGFRSILIDEASKAMQFAEEFSREPLQANLFIAIENPTNRPIKIIFNRNSETIDDVEIDLDPFAGTIEDYAKGVKFARKILDQMRKEAEANKPATTKSGKPRKKHKYIYDPARASRYWKNQVYRTDNTVTEEYLQTIAWRMEGSEKSAPFWSLLDKGVPQVMRSDRGGEAYPVSSATNFTTIAARSIKEEVINLVELEKENIINQITTQIAEAEEIEREIAVAISRAEAIPEEYRTPQVIQQIIIDGSERYLYITQTQQLGLALAPRAFGRRLPR